MTLRNIASELATSAVDSAEPILSRLCLPSPGLRHVDRRVRASVAQTPGTERASQRIITSFALQVVDRESDSVSNPRFAERLLSTVQCTLEPL